MRKILPYILSTITRYPRTIVDIGVDFEWSKDSWVHNIFRMYEWIFGRRSGIRCESSFFLDLEGKQHHEAYTFEAACAFFESQIRSFKFPRLVKVKVPVLAFAGFSPFPVSPYTGRQYMFAIAFDAADGPTTVENSVATKTLAATITGSNIYLVYNLYRNPVGGGTSSMAFNSVSMTAGPVATSPNGVMNEMWLLAGAATGTHNGVWSTSLLVDNVGMSAVSYTGVNQNTTPDSSNSASGNSTSVNITTTVVSSNCWLIAGIANQVNDSAGTGATRRVNGSASNTRNSIYDSNGTVGTGSQGMTINFDSGNYGATIISIAPPVTSAIKTINGLAVASVKTVNGLAKASVKTWNGLA